MNSPKIGIIGCGKHAKANIYPSIKLLNMDIVSVCAKHIERAEATAKQFHARAAYDDYKRMLQAEKLEAVFVITPGEQHPTIVQDCLNAGANVFVEKPLGWNAAEAQKVADLAARVRKQVMVGFMNRFAPSYLLMKQIMDDQSSFGEIMSLTGMYAIRNFAADEESYLRYAAIHYVDLIRFLFGEVQQLVGFKRSSAQEVDHIFSFACDGGKVGNMFFGGLPSWGRHYEEITITGTKGFVKVENRQRVIYHYTKQSASKKPDWQVIDETDHVVTSVQSSSSGGWQNLYLSGYVGEVEHFINCIQEGREPSSSAADNVKTVELCDRILATLKKC